MGIAALSVGLVISPVANVFMARQLIFRAPLPCALTRLNTILENAVVFATIGVGVNALPIDQARCIRASVTVSIGESERALPLKNIFLERPNILISVGK